MGDRCLSCLGRSSVCWEQAHQKNKGVGDGWQCGGLSRSPSFLRLESGVGIRGGVGEELKGQGGDAEGAGFHM